MGRLYAEKDIGIYGWTREKFFDCRKIGLETFDFSFNAC